MIDLGRMDQSLLTGNENKMIESMKRSISGRDVTSAFIEPEVEVVEQPVQSIDFNEWANKYAEPVAPVVQNQPMPVQQNEPVVSDNGGFDLDSWLNGIKTESVKTDNQVTQQPVQTAQPETNKQMFEDVINNAYTIIGQAAQQNGYSPDEVVDLAKNISPQDILDLYEIRKYQRSQRNVKPTPGPSTIGDPSQYRPVSNEQFSIAGIGAKNVRI